MVRHAAFLCLFAATLALAGVLRAATYTYHLTGNPANAEPTQTSGALLLMGGGGDVESAFRWFVTKAGGGDLVVLRASGGDGYHTFLYSTIGGIDSVETIVFHERPAAEDARVLEIIRQADGIWLAGGDQARYVRLWQGTPVAAALNAHVRAGKPLGGTSAGLAVLGQYAFSANTPGSLTSDVALQDPFDSRITLEQDFLQLDLLRGIITDSHFTARARLGRSLVFLARLLPIVRERRLLGIGIDERTALAIEADGHAQVFSSNAEGRVWLMLPTVPAERLEPGEPLTLRDVGLVALGTESTLHLPSLAIRKPAATARVSVGAGTLISLQ